MTTLNSVAVSNKIPAEVNAMSAAGAELNEFFSQDDWEFELDTMQDRSIGSLEAHLARAPVGNDTAGFLKGYLMDSRGVKFTPFND